MNSSALLQKPFLGGAEHLTEDVVSVFPAADNLEQYMMELILSSCGEETAEIYSKKIVPYQVSSWVLFVVYTYFLNINLSYL